MDYRLYLVNERDHIIDAVVLDCKSDEEAIQAAEPYRDGRDLELWQRSRLVKKIPKLP